MRGQSTAGQWAAANTIPPGPQAVRTLTDVKAPSPTNNQVLTWVDADKKWEPISPVAGIATFPITYTDGTRTWSLSVSGTILTIKAYNNATPTIVSRIEFDAAGILNTYTSGDTNVTAIGDWNLVASGTSNIGGSGSQTVNVGTLNGQTNIGNNGNVTIRGVSVNPTGGNPGDVLTSNGLGTIALAAPGATASHDYEPSFLLGGM